MKLTIISDDKAVYVDGRCFSGLTLATPTNVHALQWNLDNGWIEYNDGQPNEVITSLPTWANDGISAWDIVKVVDDEKIRLNELAELARAQKLQPITTIKEF